MKAEGWIIETSRKLEQVVEVLEARGENFGSLGLITDGETCVVVQVGDGEEGETVTVLVPPDDPQTVYRCLWNVWVEVRGMRDAAITN